MYIFYWKCLVYTSMFCKQPVHIANPMRRLGNFTVLGKNNFRFHDFYCFFVCLRGNNSRDIVKVTVRWKAIRQILNEYNDLQQFKRNQISINTHIYRKKINNGGTYFRNTHRFDKFTVTGVCLLFLKSLLLIIFC